MARYQPDAALGDLLDRVEVGHAETPRFDEKTIRASTLRSQISKAVAVTLRESEIERSDIATAMGDYLDESVPVGTLNGYASQARADNTISVERAIALCVATEDFRLITFIADQLKLAVIQRQYLPAVEEAMLTEQAELINERVRLLRRERKRAR